ncbi:HEAT repeat domain-containing protein [Streptomyces sp. NPDC005389]|uniref:HEAT repeat domain-containing protein n=1 Tax=unclassified Streptomyces TaxID=2593676 RepID=UPI0033B42E07
MATFVHLTPAVHSARVRRAGLKAAGCDQWRGVFLFPVLPSYTLTHQWLRELARRPGPRGLVAVHVRLPDDEPVTVGRYSDHRPPRVSAAEAVRRVADADDCRGWEVFLPRSVAPAEVRHIRPVRQVHGWRYRPDAHGRPPCLCFGCRDRGGYGARRLRERRPHPLDGPPPAPRVLLARVEAAEARGDTAALREALRWYGMRRRAPLARLSRLARHDDPTVRIAFVEAASAWSTPGVDLVLGELAEDPDPGVREAVADALVR